MDPDRFLWGVATAAYQVEGGLNGPTEPANNWAPWDRSGRVERCGDALEFWDRPDELLDRAAGLGCNAFRLSLEWARLQPSPGPQETSDPEWDAAALDGYARILTGCRARGLEPIVTLQHFTHPLWCGYDFWLAPDAPARFERYVRTCVRELGRRLAGRGEEPVRWWITINEPMVVPAATYFLGIFPGSGRGLARAARAYDHTIAAHIRAYDAVHDVYGEEGWPAPLVSTNNISSTVVAVDAVCVDALTARERGVDRIDLAEFLRAAHARSRRRVAAAPRRSAAAGVTDVLLDRVARRAGLRPDGAAMRELYRSARPRKLDYVSIDYYDPVAGHLFGPARGEARRLRQRPGIAELWEQEISPAGFAVFLRQAHLQAPDRPILVAESGLCSPGSRPRPDGRTRDEFVRRMGAEVLRARDEGIPVAGYVHWTIADNYEWGSYVPRFGIYGVDRSAGVRISDLDATGVDAASAFRELIATG